MSATRGRPAQTEDRVSILGSVGNTSPRWTETEDSHWLVTGGSLLRIEYGIETCCIREGSGSDFEAMLRNRDAETWVEVSADRRAKAAIVAIRVDGERVALRRVYRCDVED